MDAPPPTRPWIADTILDSNDKDQSFASGMVETWLLCILMSTPALH